MHLPDGFLDAKTAVACAGLSLAGLTISLRSLQRNLPARRIPLIGLIAAFIFSAQMLNFPVGGGTSGHLLGAVLTAVILGPSAAVLVMSAVVIMQCFMFGDGGVTTLGANLFNMALVAPICGYAIYAGLKQICGPSLFSKLFGTGLAAWCSTLVSSISCASQLALSGTVPWRIVFPAMAGVHMIIGLGEAAISILVISAIAQAQRDLILGESRLALSPCRKEIVGYGMLVSIGLALFISPLASSLPDGLEKVATTLGFAGNANASPLAHPFLQNFPISELGISPATSAIAAAIGTLAAFGMTYLLALSLSSRINNSIKPQRN